MSLTSVNYILFLLASVAVFYLVPGKYRNHVIFLAGIGFYLFFSPENLLVLMAYIWVVLLLGHLIHRYDRLAAVFTAIGIAGSILVLIYFRVLTSLKIGDFTPLGLSYCVLQSISYLRRVKSKKIPPVASPVDLFAYLLFFPKLMAGPVEDPEEFFKQLAKSGFSLPNIYRALPLISVGMAKKLAVAEVLTPAVTVTFDQMSTGSGLGSLIGIISYSLVILFDFSGYTDIAMGSALLFGLQLTENFRNPYLAVGMIDFWKRWHVSLTGWLRTNIYFSLGGSRVTKKERYLNILTVFMISGIWHGTTLGFLVWGMYHGLLQMAELYLGETLGFKSGKRTLPAWTRPIFCLLTFILASIGWVFFRAGSLNTAFMVLSGVFTRWSGLTTSLSVLGLSLWGLLFALFSILITTLMKDYIVKNQPTFLTSTLISAAAVLLALFGVILLGSSADSSFIYFNF